VLREMVTDLACARPFRRDVYRRGAARLTVAETQDMLDGLRMVGLGQQPAAEFSFDCALGQVSGKAEVYGPLTQRLLQGPLALREAVDMPCFHGATLSDILQAFALMASSGRAHPMLSPPADGAAARRLNAALAALNAAGIDRPLLMAPAIGSAIGADAMEVMVVGELLAGVPADPMVLAGRLATVLARGGRTVQRGGVVIEDPAQARSSLADTIGTLLANRVPLFRALGILDA
jgi:hypothetical protein